MDLLVIAGAIIILIVVLAAVAFTMTLVDMAADDSDEEDWI